MAAFAGLTFTGCSGSVPTTSASILSSASVVSQPAGLRSALAIATRHLSVAANATSRPFHLVAFEGKGLDASGRTIPATDSQWSFTFSRYQDDAPTRTYELVSVFVPGAGRTIVTMGASQDPALSPIENWDAAADPASPDSPDLLAYLQARNIATAGAVLVLKQGIVSIQAGGQAYAYSTVDASYTPAK